MPRRRGAVVATVAAAAAVLLLASSPRQRAGFAVPCPQDDRDKPRVYVRPGERDGKELIVDGTFASYWHPEEVATNCVWDALAAPVLALPPMRRRRILVLGLGGGSAARILRTLAPDAHIVGVEYDPAVVAAAREHFDLDSLGLEILVEDALEVLRREERRFDMIVDDVFIGDGYDVHKPDWIPEPAHDLALDLLDEGGILVSNTIDEAPLIKAGLRSRFPGLLAISVLDYDNCIFVAGPEDLDARQLRSKVACEPVLKDSLSVLRFRKAARRAPALATESALKGGIARAVASLDPEKVKKESL